MPSIFTKIIQRDLPAEIVYETDTVIAFLDIMPVEEGHTLVVPKREVPSFQDLPAEDARDLAEAMQVVARGVCKAMGTPHYNIALNNGAVAGQVVFHVHFHIMPRHSRGRRAKQPYPQGRAEEVGALIREALAAE